MQEPMFSLKVEDKKNNYGRFAIEPLTKGFGHTMGNALRRVLLSSLKGASITQVKIDGITHKFSTLEGLSQDTIDLILNLKAIRVAYDKEEPVTATLSAKGPGEVKAGDINVPATVKIANPDFVIAKLAKGAKLNIELTIESGFGYSPADERPSSTIGVIPLDAMFTPVERISYRVESTRVGRRTDYDRIIFEVFTDGTQDAEEIVKEGSRILVGYFKQVYSPVAAEEVAEANGAVVSAQANGGNSKVEVSIEELNLPTRITNALKVGGYKTIGDLMEADEKELTQVKNLGDKSIDEVNKALKKLGYALKGKE